MILFPFFIMLTLCLSNITLYPASHNFPISMRELCDRPGSKFPSLPLAGNLGNDNVHYMFDGILLLHADEINIV